MKELYTYRTIEEPRLSLYRVFGPNDFMVNVQSPQDGRRLAAHMNKALTYKMDGWTKSLLTLSILNGIAAVIYLSVVIF